MKEEQKEAPKAKFEDILSKEEKAAKQASKQVRDLKEIAKTTIDQNDFMAAMGMAVNITEQEDHKKKLAKAARGSKKQGGATQEKEPGVTVKKNTKAPLVAQKDKFASLFD